MFKQAMAVTAMLVAAACSSPQSRSETSTGGEATPTVGSSPGAAGDDVSSSPSSSSSSSSSSSAPSSGASSSSSGPAHLEVRLVDAPSTQVKSIVVTVAKVEAELASGWTVLVDQQQTVDLLTLQDGAFLSLGNATLPPGRVGQLRLYLAEGGDHHAVGLDDQSHPLTVPSGTQSGIKLVGGFEVPPCGVGQITLDFDGKASLQVGGNGNGQWMLRPVLKLKAIVASGTCADAGEDADSGGLPDPCAGITCAETEVCENGSCRSL